MRVNYYFPNEDFPSITHSKGLANQIYVPNIGDKLEVLSHWYMVADKLVHITSSETIIDIYLTVNV